MRMSNIKGLSLLLGAILMLYSQLHLNMVLMLGNDEGYELLKGFMCWKGYTLYSQIWNDQPPLYTLFVVTVFKLFGPSLMAARILAAGFGLLLFGTVFWLICQRSRIWAAWAAVFFLISSPFILLISVSVMLEVPAISLGLLAACLLFQWEKERKTGWLLVSGIVMGIALQVKLTTVMIMPAIIAQMFTSRIAGQNKVQIKQNIRAILQWGLTTILIFGMIYFIWARGSFQSSWESHFEDYSAAGFGSPKDFPFQWSLLLNHAECVVAALAALGLIIKRNCWRSFIFPVVLLLTALSIHSVHRPWWPYYYLHIAVPLAWLAGFAITEGFVASSRLLSATSFNLKWFTTWKGLAICGVLALIIVKSERRLEANIASIRSLPTVSESSILTKMAEYSSRTHWVYTENDVYAFEARLPVPPQLTVVMFKRFWSGQLTPSRIVDICRHYQVEQLVLYRSTLKATDWQNFLADFTIVAGDREMVLLVAKRIQKFNSTSHLK